MDINQKLTKLKQDISKEPLFNSLATKKARAMIDEVMKVLRERYSRLTKTLPEVSKQLNSGYGLAAHQGKDKIFYQIDSVKSEIIMNRFIDNRTTQWSVNKLNQIKRL